MKCKVCNRELVDKKGYCHGTEIGDDVFVCDTADCVKFAIGVVEAARAVVAAQYDYKRLLDTETAARRWDTINKLREALAE